MDNPQQIEIQEIIQAEITLAKAHRTLDIETFEQLLHPDYVIVQPGGKIEGKQETIDSLRSDTRHWEIAQIDELSVQLYGSTAVVTGRWRGKGQNEEVTFDYTARILSMWVKEDGAWRNVAAQSTEIDPSENE